MASEFLCDPSKTRLLEFILYLDPTDDYVNSRLVLYYWDDSKLDVKETDFNFVPDELLRDVISLVDWLENWNNSHVQFIKVNNMKLDGTFDCTIRAKANVYSRTGNHYVPSSKLPDEIRTAILNWWNDLKGSYGTRPIEVGIPLDDAEPSLA